MVGAWRSDPGFDLCVEDLGDLIRAHGAAVDLCCSLGLGARGGHKAARKVTIAIGRNVGRDRVL